MSTLQLIEILILAFYAGLVLRLALKPPLWRELRTNYRVGLIALAVLTVLAVVTMWAAVRWPAVRHSLVLIGALLATAAWWRARPDYKRSRNCPPGSLGIGRSLDAIDDRDYYRSQCEQYGPVFKMSQFGQPVICLLGLDRGRRFLKEHEESLVGASLPFSELIPGGFLRYMHAETHKAIAPLFRGALSTVAQEQFEPEVRKNFNRAFRKMDVDSKKLANGLSPGPYLGQAIFESLALVLYGLTSEDPRVNVLHQHISGISSGFGGGIGWRRRNLANFAKINSIMRDIQSSWPAQSSSLPSALRSLTELQSDAVENPVYAWNFVILSRNAFGDLLGLHNWIFKMCCDHPSALDDVRSRRDADQTASLHTADPAQRIVMETLRLEQSEYLYRRVSAPLEFEGFVVPKGWLVRLLIQESHRDPNVFPMPDRFDPSRFAERTYTRAEYSPFGADAHGCMGFRLAILLGRSLVGEMTDYDCHIVSDGPPERGSRHHDHWKPSSRLRVLVNRRKDE